MADERDFKTADFIKQPTIVNLKDVRTLSEYISSNQLVLNKIITFSILITDVEFKKAFDEYFKEYI